VALDICLPVTSPIITGYIFSLLVQIYRQLYRECGNLTMTSTAWPFAIACMYVITDIERVVSPPSGIGLVEIYLQATGTRDAAQICRLEPVILATAHPNKHIAKAAKSKTVGMS
jgi:hypothetical protein